MERSFVAKQLELYSNAIVGFMVIQSLGYSYYFGTNCQFNYLVKNAPWLAEGLAFLLSAAAVFSILGTFALGRELQQISGEYRTFVTRLYTGKAIVALVFGAVPVVVTVAYAILGTSQIPGCDSI